MRPIFIFILEVFFFISALQMQSQTSVADSLGVSVIYTPKTQVGASFLGAMIWPGFMISLERPYKYTEVNKSRRQLSRIFYKERYMGYSIGVYHHTRFHTNYFLQVHVLQRRQSSKGWWLEASEGFGLSRTFVNGAAYGVSESGDIVKVFGAGNWYGVFSMGGSLGYNGSVKYKWPMAIYLKHQWMVLLPYNTLGLIRPMIELGVRLTNLSFWKARPVKQVRTKSKSK